MIILDVLFYAYLNSQPQVDALLVSKPRCQQYAHLIKHEAAVAGVDPTLVARIMIIESGCDAKAVNKRTADYGLMQLNKMHKVPKDCLFDARCNLRAGVSILASMKKWRHYEPCAYNVGFFIAKKRKACDTYLNRLRRVK